MLTTVNDVSGRIGLGAAFCPGTTAEGIHQVRDGTAAGRILPACCCCIGGFQVKSVEAVLDAHIARTEKPRPPDGRWHPSSLFSCERQAVYEVRGTPPSDNRENKSRRILRLGTTVHEIVQRALIEDAKALAVYNEVAVDIPGLNVTGHSDTLIQHTENDWELLEFKSIGARGMQYGDLPKSEHEEQARTYAYGLRKIGGRVPGPEIANCDCLDYPCEHSELTPEERPGIIPPLGDALNRIRIVYFSRDDLRVQEFVLPIDTDWEDEFEARIARLERYRKDGEALPPRLPLEKNGKKNWLCAGYCLFRTQCWEQDGEGVNL